MACPDCGHRNPPGATRCEQCNFPLTGISANDAPPPPVVPAEPMATPGRRPPAIPDPPVTPRDHGAKLFVPGEEAEAALEPAREPTITLPRPRRRPRPRSS